MKLVLVIVSLLLALSACGDASAGADGDVAADPPAEASPSASASDLPLSAAPPTPLPAGEVRTRTLATVMDDPSKTDGPELCLGPVAESYPPQCGGLPITGWDWNGIGRGMHETQGDVRWGSYSVTGTWDGTSFTATSAVPAALYDPAAPAEEATPAPATAYDEAGLQQIADELAGQLPDASAAPVEGHVLLDVTYDDGSLQDWADLKYGAGVVLVTGALVDAT